MTQGRRRLIAFAACALLAALVATLLPVDIPFLPKTGAPGWTFHEEPTIRVLLGDLAPGASADLSGVAGTPGTRFPTPARVILEFGRDGSVRANGSGVTLPLVLQGGPDGIGYSGRRYSGDFVVDKDKPDRVVVLNRVPIERYVEGVVLSEMPPNFPEEALKAQAVASRSYAAWKIATCRSLSWDVADTQRSQVYRGNPELPKLAARMVRATRGLVLASGKRPLEAVFSSTCGGSTRSAEEAFGDAAPDPLRGVVCRACDGTTFSTWRCETDRRTVGKALGVGTVTAFSNSVRHPSDRLRSIDVLGDKGARKTVSGSALQSALGSKALSTWFTSIDVRGRVVVAEGRGFGHGVGMCQVGAGTLARRGADAGSILATYYPGASVAPLWPNP